MFVNKATDAAAEKAKTPQKIEIDSFHGSSVSDVSVCQVESNLPCEDRYSLRRTSDIEAFAIYDGHGGYLAADIATSTLLDKIISNLSDIPLNRRTGSLVAEIIDEAFAYCDSLIIQEATRLHISSQAARAASGITSRTREKGKKAMGRAGSCAIVVIITAGVLYVAHVG
jgi:serine/threonine protein phosphatase PrpC